jgi:diguanylate cyclase (GGDEF)-like protein/PAS domain S-box-containing protein
VNPRASERTGLDQARDEAVKAERIDLLYRSGRVTFINPVVALIVSALLWRIYPAWIVLGWLALIVAVFIARHLLERQFQRRQPVAPEVGRWGRYYVCGATAMGCLWGLLASVVFMTDNATFHVLAAFVLGGLIAGASLRNSAYLPAFYGFAGAAVAPMVVALLAKGSLVSAGIGLLLTIFAAVLVLAARDNNRRIIDNIRIRIEQAALTADLQRTACALTKKAADCERFAAALEESSERFRAIGDHAQDAIIIADVNEEVVYWNPAAERIFGYAPDEILGHRLHERLTPARYRDEAIAGYKQFSATGEGAVLGKTRPFTALRKDGAELPVELSISAMRLRGSWYALGIARDVSHREMIEAALREREKELEEAQRLAHVGSWVWQPETGAVQWSQELYRMFGRDPDRLAPSIAEQAVHLTPESFARFNAAMTACRETGAPYEIDLQAAHSDGSTRWISVRGEAQRKLDGGILRIRGTAQDITARRQAEKQAREEEAMFRILVEQGMSGIFIVAQDGTLAYFNPRFAEMIGGEFAAERIGRPMLDLVADADKAAMLETMEALFSGRQTSHEVPLTVLRKRGGTVNTLAQGSLATFKGERVIIVVVLDISERKQSEEEIATLHEKMAATVTQLRQHEQDSKAIAKLSDILQSCHTRTEAYPIIAMSAGNLFRGMNGALALVADETHELETIAQWGAGQTTLERFSFDACWALRTGQRYEVSDLDHGTLCRHFKSAPGGPYLCLPLMVHGEMSGMLHLEVAPDSDIDDELRQLMLTIGDVVKLSLSNLKLRESLSELAMRDELTGLFNRHYLSETLPREIHRAARNKTLLTVAIMDVDHFKAFNDTQGHDAGDEVLRQLGALLQHSVRSGDIACRYGGEELLLVLPDCDSSDAKTRLEHLCKEIREKSFLFRGNALPSVTLSVGLAQLSEDLLSAEALITAADEALYRAKHNGRDRVEVFASKIRRKARAPKA